MTIRMRFFVTILLFVLCVGCLFGAMYVSADGDNTIDTKLTLSGFSSGLTRTHNNGVDYVAISSKGFYATMPLNEVYVDGEENWTGGVRFRPTSGAVKLNGNNANGVSILKYGATSYYVEGFTLSAGDVLQFGGVFYNDANGNGRRDNGEIALDIAVTRIVYDGEKYAQQAVQVDEPYSSFAMVKGASLRLDAGTGLKFAATLSQADYTILARQNATFGFAFVRADDVVGDKLTADDLFSNNATFGNGTQKTLITTLSSPVEVNGVYRMEGCLRDVSDVYTEYVAVAYAKVGSNYTLAKFWANDMSRNTRSCYYAAQLAIDDGDSSAAAIQAQYIDVATPHTETLTVKTMLLGNGKIVDIETASQVAVNSVQRVVAPDKDRYELVGDSEVQVKIYANRPQTVTFVYEDRTARNMTLSAFAPPMNTQDFNLYKNEVHPRFKDFEAGMAAARLEGKPVMVDFTGFGCVNCRKMEAAVWTDSNVADMLNQKYVLISLYVDDKTPLPEPMTVTDTDGTQRTLRTIGDKWSYLQRYKFGSNTQPMYVLIDNDGMPLTGSRSYDEDINEYMKFLQTGLDNYNNNKK